MECMCVESISERYPFAWMEFWVFGSKENLLLKDCDYWRGDRNREEKMMHQAMCAIQKDLLDWHNIFTHSKERHTN